MTRYHVTYHFGNSPPYTTARATGVTEFADREIADALAGKTNAPDKIEECTKERCNLCASDLDVNILYEQFKKGELVLETSGSYSDYGIGKLVKVLKPFYREELTLDQAVATKFAKLVEYTELWSDD